MNSYYAMGTYGPLILAAPVAVAVATMLLFLYRTDRIVRPIQDPNEERDQLLEDVARLVLENQEVTKENGHLLVDNIQLSQRNAVLMYENARLRGGRPA
ncbi:hypothetical protein FKM82_007950 [Ascaphus truei]